MNFKKSFKNLPWVKDGQATLEFVFLIPLIIIIILIVFQSGHMVYRNNTLQQAAREGVRVLSTTNSNTKAVQAIKKVCGSRNNPIPDINIHPFDEEKRRLGDIVTISLTDTSNKEGVWRIITNTIGKVIPVKAESSMRMECY